MIPCPPTVPPTSKETLRAKRFFGRMRPNSDLIRFKGKLRTCLEHVFRMRFHATGLDRNSRVATHLAYLDYA